ncbi:MAG: hypothetical protein COB09_08255 [Thalassobium sp.]|nr:MAG: hypothetical protein COB09_08255 [Thalassobium sp.]
MQFSVYINQLRAQEWGLNLSQTVLFSFLYEAHSWASEFIVDGQAYYWVAKEKICEELPILTDKPDTIKRLMAALESEGLISRAVVGNLPLIRITEKGRLWNNTGGGKVGKKIPTSTTGRAGKKSLPNYDQGREKNPDLVGKKIPTGREKNPPNQITISNNHNQTTTPTACGNVFGNPTAEPYQPKPETVFSEHWQPDETTVRRIAMLSIPEDFIRGCVPEFVAYWLTEGKPPFGGNYETAFFKSTRKAWTLHQNNSRRGNSHGSIHASPAPLDLTDTDWIGDYGKSPFDAPADPAGCAAGELATDRADADFYEMAGGVDAGRHGRSAPGLAHDAGGAGRDE